MTSMSSRAVTRILLLCALACLGCDGRAAAPPPPAAAVAQAWVPQEETRCDFYAWNLNAETGAVPVYAAPKSDAKLIGWLPPLEVLDSGVRYRAIAVLGSFDGWLRIRDAGYDHMGDMPAAWEERGDDAPVFDGSGWINGNGIAVVVQSGFGFVRPNVSSPLVYDLGSDWLREYGKVVAVVACRGEWALLDVRRYKPGETESDFSGRWILAPDEGRAWFRRLCNIRETTCDGVVDSLEEQNQIRAQHADQLGVAAAGKKESGE